MDYFLVLIFWFSTTLGATSVSSSMSSETMPNAFGSKAECDLVGKAYETPADHKGIVVRYQCVPDGSYFSASEFEKDVKDDPRFTTNK